MLVLLLEFDCYSKADEGFPRGCVLTPFRREAYCDRYLLRNAIDFEVLLAVFILTPAGAKLADTFTLAEANRRVRLVQADQPVYTVTDGGRCMAWLMFDGKAPRRSSPDILGP